MTPTLSLADHLHTAAHPVLAAVSGGADSTALALLLHEAKVPFGIAHFTHHIRPGVAEHERSVVEALAQRLHVPFFHGQADVPAVVARRGGNLEERARTIRYGWLHRVAHTHGYHTIVTGHNQDDHIETMLLQLLRGSATVAGIRQRRGMVERPLLEIPASDLREYLLNRGETWLTDETNLDTTYNRVWLRHEIVPQLAKRYPAVRSALARYGVAQDEQRAAVREAALRTFPRFPCRIAALQHAPKAVVLTALAEHLHSAHLPVTQELLLAAYHAIQHHASWRRDITSDVSLVIQYGELSLITHGKRSRTLTAPWRPLKPGDVVYRSGGTKLVSDVLIDEKIPAHERRDLYVKESGGYVTEIAGLFRIDEQGHIEWTEPRRKYMGLALGEALRARAAGDVPVGAVVVSAEGEVLGAGRNQREGGSPFAHAEIEAITQAANTVGDWRLSGATLYVTLEPCPMCAGAILQTHISEVVFGADNHRDGALGTVTNIFAANWKRSVSVTGGIFADKSAKLLQMAFTEARVR